MQPLSYLTLASAVGSVLGVGNSVKGCPGPKVLGSGFDVTFYSYPFNDHRGYNNGSWYFTEGYKEMGSVTGHTTGVTDINFNKGAIDLHSHSGEIYGETVQITNFGMVLTGWFYAEQSGEYQLTLPSEDEGISIQFGRGKSCCGNFDDEIVTDEMSYVTVRHPSHNKVYSVQLIEGLYYPMRLVYFNAFGGSKIQIPWTMPDGTTREDFKNVRQIDTAKEYCAVFTTVISGSHSTEYTTTRTDNTTTETDIVIVEPTILVTTVTKPGDHDSTITSEGAFTTMTGEHLTHTNNHTISETSANVAPTAPTTATTETTAYDGYETTTHTTTGPYTSDDKTGIITSVIVETPTAPDTGKTVTAPYNGTQTTTITTTGPYTSDGGFITSVIVETPATTSTPEYATTVTTPYGRENATTKTVIGPYTSTNSGTGLVTGIVTSIVVEKPSKSASRSLVATSVPDFSTFKPATSMESTSDWKTRTWVSSYVTTLTSTWTGVMTSKTTEMGEAGNWTKTSIIILTPTSSTNPASTPSTLGLHTNPSNPVSITLIQSTFSKLGASSTIKSTSSRPDVSSTVFTSRAITPSQSKPSKPEISPSIKSTSRTLVVSSTASTTSAITPTQSTNLDVSSIASISSLSKTTTLRSAYSVSPDTGDSKSTGVSASLPSVSKVPPSMVVITTVVQPTGNPTMTTPYTTVITMPRSSTDKDNLVTSRSTYTSDMLPTTVNKRSSAPAVKISGSQNMNFSSLKSVIHLATSTVSISQLSKSSIKNSETTSNEVKTRSYSAIKPSSALESFTALSGHSGTETPSISSSSAPFVTTTAFPGSMRSSSESNTVLSGKASVPSKTDLVSLKSTNAFPGSTLSSPKIFSSPSCAYSPSSTSYASYERATASLVSKNLSSGDIATLLGNSTLLPATISPSEHTNIPPSIAKSSSDMISFLSEKSSVASGGVPTAVSSALHSGESSSASHRSEKYLPSQSDVASPVKTSMSTYMPTTGSSVPQLISIHASSVFPSLSSEVPSRSETMASEASATASSLLPTSISSERSSSFLGTSLSSSEIIAFPSGSTDAPSSTGNVSPESTTTFSGPNSYSAKSTMTFISKTLPSYAVSGSSESITASFHNAGSSSAITPVRSKKSITASGNWDVASNTVFPVMENPSASHHSGVVDSAPSKIASPVVSTTRNNHLQNSSSWAPQFAGDASGTVTRPSENWTAFHGSTTSSSEWIASATGGADASSGTNAVSHESAAISSGSLLSSAECNNTSVGNATRSSAIFDLSRSAALPSDNSGLVTPTYTKNVTATFGNQDAASNAAYGVENLSVSHGSGGQESALLRSSPPYPVSTTMSKYLPNSSSTASRLVSSDTSGTSLGLTNRAVVPHWGLGRLLAAASIFFL